MIWLHCLPKPLRAVGHRLRVSHFARPLIRSRLKGLAGRILDTDGSERLLALLLLRHDPRRWLGVAGIIVGTGLFMAGYWALRTVHTGQHVCGTCSAVLIQSSERQRDHFRRARQTVKQQIPEAEDGMRYIIVHPDMSRAVGDHVVRQLHCNADDEIMRTASIRSPERT